eukprot:316906_1
MSDNGKTNNNNWDSTQLRDETNTPLTVQDIKQLLITRGVTDKKQLKGKKADLIKLLKSNYSVTFSQDPQSLTNLQLRTEAKLRGFDVVGSRRDRLIAPLMNKANQWFKQTAVNIKIRPDHWRHKIHVIDINDNEFYRIHGTRWKINLICKYKAAENEWETWSIDPIELNLGLYACYNQIDKSIYVYEGGTLLKINFERRDITKIAENLGVGNNISQFISANNKLHFIVNNWPKQHLILDLSSRKFDECLSFKRLYMYYGQCELIKDRW